MQVERYTRRHEVNVFIKTTKQTTVSNERGGVARLTAAAKEKKVSAVSQACYMTMTGKLQAGSA